MSRNAGHLTTLGLILLGLVMMATPLALWVAWTDTILILVLAVGVTAGVLYCILVRFERPTDPVSGDSAGQVWAQALPTKSVEELSDLHPYIHHHRPSGSSPRFRQLMERLKRQLY